MRKISETSLVVITALFFVTFDNASFFSNVVKVYPVSADTIFFLISLTVTLTSLTVLTLVLLGWPYTTKPLLILFLLLSSLAGYFMDHYHIVIDHRMIQNVMQTDYAEAGDLFSPKLALYFLLLGVAPSALVYAADLEPSSIRRLLTGKLKIVGVLVLIVLSQLLLFGKFYASFLREHKPLRYYANPMYYLYSLGKLVSLNAQSSKGAMKVVGADARIPDWDQDRELIILVIGEAARADRLSINGYERKTCPLLEKEDLINFPNMYSCGTSTAVSVPCMFSIFGREKFSEKKSASTENLLDVLKHAGVSVLWRDNNSDSKGVALRAPYQDFKSPKNNPDCDIECRDEGMLSGLQEHIDRQTSRDVLIVLHQMGNHGPFYSKRYPESFEKFTPVCPSNQLESCTTEEINNAYDNAILYTDHFLSKVIDLLKQNSSQFETAMFYVSDHGESLGENGLYLHGLPYFMAPDEQKHVASFMWFGDSFKIDKESLRKKANQRFTHDNLFHTILGLMEIETSVYNKDMDIIHLSPK